MKKKPKSQGHYRITKLKYLSDEEYNLLLDRLQEIKIKHPRDAALIFLALATGARATELLNLTKADFDFSDIQNPTVFIRGLKRSNDREIPITTSLAKQIMKLSFENEEYRPFNFSRMRLTRIWHRIRHNITKKTFHSLRHTFAVRHLKRTGNIKLIQLSLGHRCISNTQVYADYVLEKAELKKLLLG